MEIAPQDRSTDKFKKIKLLKYHEGLINSAKNDHDFCKILVTRLIPLMRILAPDLYNQWEQEKKACLSKQLELEAKALYEATEYFELLKQRLNNENLLHDQYIKQRICIIETMLSFGVNNQDMFTQKSIAPESVPCFKYRKTKSGLKELYLGVCKKDFEVVCLNCEGLEINHRIYVLPSYVWGVCTEVKNLGELIISSSREDLVKEQGKIQSILELCYESEKLNNPFEGESDQELWNAFEILYRIEWAWNISRDYLRKKKLAYDDAENCAESALFLGLKSLELEVKKLKPNIKRQPNTFFCNRNDISRALNIILKKVYDENIDQALSVSGFQFPYSLELIMKDEIHLYLDAEWISGIKQCFFMHTFQYLSPLKKSIKENGNINDNIRCNFITDLLDNPKKLIEMNPSEATINATQYLRKTGIRGIIDKLFIDKKTRYGAVLKSKKITLTNQSSAILRKVKKYLEPLDVIACDKCREFYCQISNKCAI